MNSLRRLLPAIVLSCLFVGGATGKEQGEGLQGEYLFDLVLETSAPQRVGPRLIVPIEGGQFDGPGIQGTVLDGGADWILPRDDGANALDVRITLRTDDDALIYMSYKGLLIRNENESYWRMVPTFETGSEKYQFLTRLIAVGIGKQVDGKTAYSVYRVL